MNQRLISIIMPVYNTEHYVAEAIESVVAQTCANWELIIIDDGSTDNSYEIIKNYLSHDKIKCIRQSNKGESSARNAGIKNATGKYIAFIDSDDKFFPDFVNKIDIVHTSLKNEFDIIQFGRQNEKIPIYFDQREVSPTECLQNILIKGSQGYNSACNKVYLRSFIAENHLEFQRFSNFPDIVFSVKAYARSSKIFQLKDILYFVRYRESSASRAYSTNMEESLFLATKHIKDELQNKNYYDKFYDCYLTKCFDLLLCVVVNCSLHCSKKPIHQLSLIRNKFIKSMDCEKKDLLKQVWTNKYISLKKKLGIISFLYNISLSHTLFKLFSVSVFRKWALKN